MNRNESRSVWAIVAVVSLVLVLFIALMMGGGVMGGGMMGNWNWGSGGNPLGGLLTLVFWALLIGGVLVVVLWALGQVRPTNNDAGNQQDALEILKQRYARGEINKEQFEQIKRDLTTN